MPSPKPKPSSTVHSGTISTPDLVKKPSTVAESVVSTSNKADGNSSEIVTIPSSSLVNWKQPKWDNEGHVLIDFDLKNKPKKRKRNEDYDNDYQPNNSVKPKTKAKFRSDEDDEEYLPSSSVILFILWNAD